MLVKSGMPHRGRWRAERSPYAVIRSDLGRPHCPPRLDRLGQCSDLFGSLTDRLDKLIPVAGAKLIPLVE
eukprot:8829299-Heterocapsa_arctica.AAC.1